MHQLLDDFTNLPASHHLFMCFSMLKASFFSSGCSASLVAFAKIYLVKSRSCSNMGSHEALLVNQKQGILKKAAMVGKKPQPNVAVSSNSWELLLETQVTGK